MKLNLILIAVLMMVTSNSFAENLTVEEYPTKYKRVKIVAESVSGVEIVFEKTIMKDCNFVSLQMAASPLAQPQRSGLIPFTVVGYRQMTTEAGCASYERTEAVIASKPMLIKASEYNSVSEFFLIPEELNIKVKELPLAEGAQ
jgi:hypothetical protein